MKFVGVLEAKTHLSRLLDEIEATGEPLVITRHGKPVATIYGAGAGAGPVRAAGVADGDGQAAFQGEAEAPSDPFAEAEAMLKADPGLRDRLRASLKAASTNARRPEPCPRKLSGPELVELFRQLRETQPTDPVLDAMSWEELKELARS
ncbi:type II toxin-antitoxin system Phd/YefM family antitoxin [Alkalicaulis satelles]|uniref:Antitoxin n=1 Tax=Alkalicaulis satelles TaxID=2609175 RepID=A0A5M6ZNT9_9PROT|nr:type II toxin-antitoxin system Phd/YefM family antitoxin [Alkalicaulis satelles]KAA5804898.1 type II toxin-antitoxin system Phd/YefM family antitoxin [Alkalicaulis satelles]